MNTRYNTGTRSSTYNKTATYNTNASSTMAPRKTSYSLDLRKSTSYNMNARAAAPSSKVPCQATTAYQIALSNSTVPNQIAAGTNTTQTDYGTNANSVAYNVGTGQLEYSLPSVTLDFNAIAKLIAPQQISSPSSPNSLMLTEVLGQPVAQKEAPTKPSECQIPAIIKSTAKELPSSSTSQSSFQIATSINNMASFKTSPSGKFARPATPKPASNAGIGNVFVKTRPNTVVRAELIKNKTTKRTEPVKSVSRTKDDEYKAGKKPKPAFKTKLVNKHCTYYHKYGRCKEGDFCAYKHDPNRVEVCKLWLKGSECTLGSKCPLQHVESAHLIPYCRHFCKGMCLKDDCHYTHVKVSKRAPHCKDFMVGRYCPAGTECRKKHEWGLYEEPTETESEAGKKRTRDLAEEEVEREKIKKLREEMANGVNPFAAGWTFIPIDD